MHFIVSLIAVLGFGSIVAALVGWAVAISSYRHTWINGLRDDLAVYFRELEGMHYAIIDLYAGTTNAEQKKRDARLAVLFSYSRVVLRLNLTEPMHVELRQRLDEFMTVDRVTPDRERIEGAVDLARKILKQEWEVTKYGPLTGWIQRLKSPKRSN